MIEKIFILCWLTMILAGIIYGLLNHSRHKHREDMERLRNYRETHPSQLKGVTIHDDNEVRESIAEILEDIEKNGMPNPRDLDVALDAILTGIEARFILIPRKDG